jgi:ATP-dependent DNA ligase
MPLRVKPPILPMLAKRVGELPPGDGWIFEPKWDGFRTLVFRDGEDVYLQSRDEKPLARYFPEMVAALKAALPKKCVLDGELVIAVDSRLEFDALQMRLHPAESRVKMLAEKVPASFVAFDLLCDGDADLRDKPFVKRRARLEKMLARAKAPIHVTPATADRKKAADWFKRFEGAGLDGVIAKREEGVYEPNKRVMLKVKHERDCDCVVAGFRWHRKEGAKVVGSLLLGLYDDKRVLHHVGAIGSFTNEKRAELVKFLAPFRKNALEKHPWKDWADAEAHAMQRKPGSQSRWSQGKDQAWELLRPELVVEVAYDHMQGDRFRHLAQFRRWRDDKKPRDCTYAQLEVVPPAELRAIFGK